MKKGTLIVIEGITGAGKTYFANQLEEALVKDSRLRVKRMGGFGPRKNQEDDPPITRLLRSFMKSSRFIGLPWLCETTLLLSEQAYNIDKELLPAYNKGFIILYENYNDALVAYQLVRGKVLGIDSEKLLQVLQTMVSFQFVPFGYPREDLTVYLAASITTCCKRLRKRDPGTSVSHKDKFLMKDIMQSYETLNKKKLIERINNDKNSDLHKDVKRIATKIMDLHKHKADKSI